MTFSVAVTCRLPREGREWIVHDPARCKNIILIIMPRLDCTGLMTAVNKQSSIIWIEGSSYLNSSDEGREGGGRGDRFKLSQASDQP